MKRCVFWSLETVRVDSVKWPLRSCLAATIAVALTGCAVTATQTQAECEGSRSAIGDIVQCMRGTLAQKNPAKLQEPKVKLYLLRGEQLAGDVAAGKMSNTDARVVWQRLYLELTEPSPQEKAAQMQAISQIMRQQQQQTEDSGYKIVRPPTTTVCNSSPVLGQIRTECTSR